MFQVNWAKFLKPQKKAPPSLKKRSLSENDKRDDNDDVFDRAADEESNAESVEENQQTQSERFSEIQEIKERLATVNGALRLDWGEYFKFAKEALIIQANKKEKVNDENLKEFLTNLVDKVKRHKVDGVRSFELKVPCGSQITDIGIKAFAESFKNCFTSLEGLTLDIFDCEKLTDQGIEALAASISQNNKSLKSLNLRLAASYYPSYLFEPLRQFKLTDHGLQALGNNISVHLSKLTHLNLDFSHCYDITDVGVSNLIMTISDRLKGLQELKLWFDCCHGVADFGVQSIASSLSNLTELRVFDLKFNGCWKITDKGFSALGEQIFTNLKQLKTLSLDFSRCWKISDESVRVLNAAALRENLNSQMDTFTLVLAWCDKITNQGVNLIDGAICHGFPKLNHLTLNFAGCYNVTQEEIQYCAQSISESLKRIKHLRLYLPWLTEEKRRQDTEGSSSELPDLSLKWDEKKARVIEGLITEKCNHPIIVEVR